MLGLAFSATVYFASKIGTLPDWKEKLDELDRHWVRVQLSAVEVASNDANIDALRHIRPYTELACMEAAGKTESLKYWEQHTPRVSEIQALDKIEVLVPDLETALEHDGSKSIAMISVDCQARLAHLSLTNGEQPDAPLASHPKFFDPTELTVINGYPEYGAVRDATVKAARAIIKHKLELAIDGSDARLPTITKASYNLVGIMLVVLMIRLIWKMNEIREIAIAGRAAEILAFPWELTMNRKLPRRMVAAVSLLPLVWIAVGLHFWVQATRAYEGRYREPGGFELVVTLAVLSVTLALLASQIRLQFAVPTKKGLYHEPKPSIRHVGTLPVRFGPFVGRVPELSAIHESLRTVPILVLTGPTGMGTTALAREYATREQSDYPDGLYAIECEDSIAASLAKHGDIVLQLTFQGKVSEADRARAALAKLANLKCLLIYDGVTEPEELRYWLPPTGHNAHVLATSRCPVWPLPFRPLEIDPLPPEALAELWTLEGLPPILATEFSRRNGNTAELRRQLDRLLVLQRALESEPDGPWLGCVIVSLHTTPIDEGQLFAVLQSCLETTEIATEIERCRRHGLLEFSPDPLAQRLILHHALERQEQACVMVIAASEHPVASWREQQRFAAAVSAHLCRSGAYRRAEAWARACVDTERRANLLVDIEQASELSRVTEPTR